ncbi:MULTISPECIES: transporter substrate-binding domain-containing protein [unclassified Moraxella]|uniref:ABC transporter substrate-binding protein n=1 Tax=unclassified Moraxella TaxID=2685852 RepID=UPI003AF4B126
MLSTMFVKYTGTAVLLSSLLLTACSKNEAPSASSQPNQASQPSTQTKTQATPASSTATASSTSIDPKMQVITVGVEATYPPYESLDEKGSVVGFDKDILDAIGEKQGFKANFLPKSWDGLLDGVNTNKYDLAMSAVSRDEEREQAYLLSNTYAYDSDAILTKDSVTDIKTFDDLKNRKVAVQKDTPTADDLFKLQGEDSPNIIQKTSSYLAIKAVIQGEADAVVADSGLLHYHVKSIPNMKFFIGGEGDYFAPYEMVVVAKKGNTAVIDKFNIGLGQIIADGTYAKIYEKWFGTAPTPKQIPHTNTTTVASATH